MKREYVKDMSGTYACVTISHQIKPDIQTPLLVFPTEDHTIFTRLPVRPDLSERVQKPGKALNDMIVPHNFLVLSVEVHHHNHADKHNQEAATGADVNTYRGFGE